MASKGIARLWEATTTMMARMGRAETAQPDYRVLEMRLRSILPERYEDRYDEVEPVSMGSAALKYGPDGKVAWGEIWGSFCDLAMAGGPPHKGKLLEPGSAAEIAANAAQYRSVVEEITRGIRLASEVAVSGPNQPGWVRVDCGDRTMAQWLLRAVTMENVSCRWQGTAIDLPAGPQYRIEKEIKNVVTSITKTAHYWSGHMGRAKKEEARKAFAQMEAECPLVQAARAGVDCTAEAQDALARAVGAEIASSTGLRMSDRRYFGWVGVECGSVRAAVWMMRVLTAMNGLARREGTELFVAVNAGADPQGQAVVAGLRRVHELARLRAVIRG